MADLRFTTDEAINLFQQMLTNNVVLDDLLALAGRTEGWAAGLQMAAISLQRRAPNPGIFPDGLLGENRSEVCAFDGCNMPGCCQAEPVAKTE